MSFIGKNIKKIRTVKNLSQAAFAQLFNLARPSVGAYEEGRSEPKIETLVQIAQYFGISIDLLLTKELTVNELYGFDIFKENYSQNKMLKEVAEDSKKDISPAVPFISTESTASYLKKTATISQFPTLILPLKSTDSLRAFEVSNDEAQQVQGLNKGDVVMAAAVDITNPEALIKHKVYVVVISQQVFIKRLTSITAAKILFLKAENTADEIIEIPLNEVKELWEVQAVFTSFGFTAAPLEERVSQLEQSVQQLSKRLLKLEK